MGYPGSLALLALLATLGVYVYRKYSHQLRQLRLSREYGCLPAPRYPHKDPILGLDLFLDQFHAMKRGDTLTTERGRFAEYGKTFETNSWGTRSIETMDVKNVQAVLSQSFDNFGVEPMRLHIGRPFIGKGVFSTDGDYWQYSRDLTKPMFARAQVSDLASLDVHMDRMLNRIPRDGSTVDLQLLLKLLVCFSPIFSHSYARRLRYG